jgi:hypothetical protein
MAVMSRTLALIAVLVAALPILAMERVRVSSDKTHFVLEKSGKEFSPWGFNYDRDHSGRLIEDYWETEWSKVETDFRSMKQLGANVVRVHIQFGKFMQCATTPNKQALERLQKLLKLAEKLELYIDLTGLGCYHKKDIPPWYDAMNEAERWDAQAQFWRAVADRCKKSPALFCYDLMNEPVSPGALRKSGDWLAPPMGDKHFVQVISLDPAGRPRAKIAQEWVQKLVSAIREKDADAMITVGLLPGTPERVDYYSGFIPADLTDLLDYISVHVYPERNKIDAGLAVGRPIVVEETFPMACSVEDLGTFMDRSKNVAGWIGFFWGKMPDDLRESKEIVDHITRSWLEFFQKRARRE